MDAMAMLDEFRRLNPRRRIIYLNTENEKYNEDYISFNLDILSEGLSNSSLAFEISGSEIIIRGEDIFKRLLFECGIFCRMASNEGEAILKPYAGVCDIMTAICRIKTKFEK